MFDFGFWEILLIGVVALLIVGPNRLPGLATFAGHWVGRLRRMARTMRSEIQQELEAEHLKSLLNEQTEEISNLRREIQGVRGQAENVMRESTSAVREVSSAGVEEKSADAAGSARVEVKGDGQDAPTRNDDAKDQGATASGESTAAPAAQRKTAARRKSTAKSRSKVSSDEPAAPDNDSEASR